MITLTLPSNASPERYPDNTVATFKTDLSEPINLQGSGEYEIGLAEIQHPTVIRNINDCWLSIELNNTYIPRRYMSSGLYTDERHFFGELTKAINQSASEAVTLVYGPESRRVSLALKPQTRLFISRNLADILGFDKASFSNLTSDPRVFTSEQAYDLFRGLDQIFVYCDLCSNVILGHTSVPLLRCIRSNVSNAPKPQCTTFNRINFVPMSVRNFNSVLVYLRLGDGRAVPFMSGTCVATLIIRRKQRIY